MYCDTAPPMFMNPLNGSSLSPHNRRIDDDDDDDDDDR
jgi:hypothetical protein